MDRTAPYCPKSTPQNNDPLIALRLDIVRQLVDLMSSMQLWMPDEKYHRILETRQELGIWLRQELLSPVLGCTDDNMLNSRSIYGFTNYRFRSRIPRILSFGYGMGIGLHDLVSPGSNQQSQPARLCAIYNFGIALFDRAGDSCRNNFQLFQSLFNEKLLIKLFDDPVGYKEIARSAEKITITELRILLKVICIFFSDLHQSAQIKSRPREWIRLKEILMDAYRSQMHTMLPGKGTQPPMPGFAERKSTLPFIVMSQLIRLHQDLSPEIDRKFNSIVQALAGIFWKLDDLVDLPLDIASEDINSLLPPTHPVPGENPSKALLSQEDLAEYFLNGPEIPGAVKTLCTDLSSLLESLNMVNLQASQAGQTAEFSFPEMLLAYVRSWIPKRLITNIQPNQKS